MKTLIENNYPRAFIRSASASRAQKEPNDDNDNETEKTATAFFLYVTGVSERIKKECRDFNIKVVFKPGPTLHSLLTKVKDPLLIDK